MANFHKVKGKKVCNAGYRKVRRGRRLICAKVSRHHKR